LSSLFTEERNALTDDSRQASSAPGQPPKFSLVDSITKGIQNLLQNAREERLFL